MRYAYSLPTALVATLLSALFPLAVGATKPMESPVYLFSDHSIIAKAASYLKTNKEGASMRLHTSELTPKNAVTVWWLVFNHPENCTHGTAPYSCGREDLAPLGGDPSVESSVIFGAGRVIGGKGEGKFSSHLSVGDTEDALFGSGLTNPLGAEIHFVVRDHGPKDPSLMPGQIREVNVCNTTCEDLQFSVQTQ